VPKCAYLIYSVSYFVNYKKRDVTLPWGWTDLIQVLLATKHSPNAPPGAQEHQEGYTSCEIVKPLSQIEKYVSLVVDSKTALSLHILPFAGKQLGFAIQKLPSNEVQASVTIRMQTQDETSVRRFWEARGFKAPDKSVPSFFNPDLPVDMICDISPLPADDAQVAKLAADFFREVCGLNDQSELAFYYTRWNGD